MRRSFTPVLAAVALGVLPAAATAQLPSAPQSPAPPARAGKMSIKVSGGPATKKLRYVARGASIRVSGEVEPFVAGQTVVLEVVRKRKVASRRRIAVGAGGV